MQHPDPQHLAKVLWKSKFAFGDPGLTGHKGDETASGGDFLPRATPRDFGPTAGPPAPLGQHPLCPASSPGTGQHFCTNISPLRLLRCTPTWAGSTQNHLLPANHKSPGNGAETTSKVRGSCWHRLRFWGLEGEAGGSSSDILNTPLLRKQPDEPTVISLA